MDKKYEDEYPSAILNIQGKQIIYSHYLDCKGLKETTDKFGDQIEFVEKNRQVKLMLVNYTGAALGREYISMSKKSSHLWDPIKTALIGIDGVKKVLLMGYNKVVKNKMIPFDSEEEAIAYLLEE